MTLTRRALVGSAFALPLLSSAILRAADRRLGRACLLTWAGELDPEHPALVVIGARFGIAIPEPARGTSGGSLIPPGTGGGA